MPPALTIQLIKRAPPKGPLLRCVRADGTETLADMVVGPEHDLAHYSVETTLGYNSAFYSMLARGMSIQDFNVQAATTKIDIPDVALYTEFIVGLLQMERASGKPYDDFNDELMRTVAAARKRPTSPIPTISDADLATIRAKLDELMTRWIALPISETLELKFDVH